MLHLCTYGSSLAALQLLARIRKKLGLQLALGDLISSPTIELLADTFGGRGWFADEADALEAILPEAMAYEGPGILHIKINPRATRKKQEFPFGSLQSMLTGAKKKSML